jgi:DNA-binding NtrC family response regulator
MPFTIQAKILRLLQEKSIERLGGKQPIPVDVRIIAATNRDLEAAVKEGKFREDLYYRLKVVSLNLPPLRDRKDDIPLLTDYFMKHHCHDMQTPNPGISEKARNELKSYSWPGNVRELSNTIQKALIFCQGGPLDLKDIMQAIDNIRLSESDPISDGSEKPDAVLRRWIRKQLTADNRENLFETLMDYFGSMVTSEALKKTDGNRSHAAKLLGLSRPTLLSKIEKFNIKIKADVDFY